MKASTTSQIGGGDMIDITGPDEEVEVLYRDGVLWVNIDGVCRLRCCQMTRATLKFDISQIGLTEYVRRTDETDTKSVPDPRAHLAEGEGEGTESSAVG